MPTAKKEVEWFKGKNNLSEIYQQTGMIFSFMSSPKAGSKQCHNWVKCRDFLQDAVRAQLTGNKSSIYGFTFATDENPPLDIGKMRMLVSKHDLKTAEDIETFMAKMKAGLILLNHFEKTAKVALSTMKVVEPKGSGKKAVVIFTGSAIWMKSPFLVSLYTYLIRLGDKEIKFKNAADLKKKMKGMVEDFTAGKAFKGDNDISYMKTIWPKLHLIMKNRSKLFPAEKRGFHNIYWDKLSISQFHNNGGILSLCNGNTPNKELNEAIKALN